MRKLIRIVLFFVAGTAATVYLTMLRPLKPSDVRLESDGIKVDCSEVTCTCRLPFTAYLSPEAQSRLLSKDLKARMNSTFRVRGRLVDECNASDTFRVDGPTVSGSLSCSSTEAAAETTAAKTLARPNESFYTECDTDFRAAFEILPGLEVKVVTPPEKPPRTPPKEEPPHKEPEEPESEPDKGSDHTQPEPDTEPERPEPEDTPSAPPPPPAPRGCTNTNGGGEDGLSFPPGLPGFTVSTTSASQLNWTVLDWGVSYRNQNVGRAAYTGSVRVSLWAVSIPYDGGELNGYKIATAYPNFYGNGARSRNQLYNYSSTQLRSRVVGRNPPPGMYCLLVTLEQHNSQSCNTADHFCIADWQQYRWQGFW